MPRVTMKYQSGLEISVDAEGVKPAIQALSPFMEVFGEDECVRCGCRTIRFEHRKKDDYNYYSAVCCGDKCGAKLDFGQKREGGTLYPKRKDKDGNWLPNRGWLKWGEKADGTTAPEATATPDTSSVQEPPF